MCAAPKDYNVHKLVYESVNTVISRYCKQGVKKSCPSYLHKIQNMSETS